jgi:DNA-directed RNA polymerases I, II, and III subunit RPABC2
MSNNFDFPSDKEILEKMNSQKKMSLPFLTKYEKARIIGLRTQQLSNGAQPLVDTRGLRNYLDIAEKELKDKKIPFIIKRELPNNKSEYWKISELINIE